MTTYMQTAIEDAMQAPPAPPPPAPPQPGDGPPRLAGIVTECWDRTRELRRHVGEASSVARSGRARVQRESGFDVAPPKTGKTYDPYTNVSRDVLEAVVRAAASAHQPPEILMAIWQREGSLGMPLGAWPVPQASSAANAKILARSDIYWEKLGTDHFTAARPNPQGGENIFSDRDEDAAAHQTRFRAAIRELVTAHQLSRDISGDIDAELTVAARSGGGFDVTPSIRFYALSLLLVDALFTKLWQNTFPEAASYGAMLNYQQWNMGLSHFEAFLRSAEHHRHEREYKQADGSAPSLEQWAHHTRIKATEYAQPRRNAIRFGYMVDSFAPIFSPALNEIRRSAPGGGGGAAGTPAQQAPPQAGGQSLAIALDDPIEGYQYDPTGTTCAAGARPGATALLHELQARYRGNSDGIFNCRPVRGGTRLSLHGEGRAVDWHLNAAETTDAAEAQRIIDWLLASDSDGNADALARRMGVQEIIWNRQIWSARRHAEGFRPYNGVNPHTDHLHIGLNKAGAEAHTSYWRAHPSTPPHSDAPPSAQALSLPASALHWQGATPEQLDFMRRVYEVQLRRAERVRPFVGDVAANELAVIEAGTKARTAAAAACRELLAAARADLMAAQAAHDPHAGAVERIGLVSGYRSASQQLAAWQANFPTYYARTQTERQRTPGGEYGEQAVEIAARYIGARLAAPGFSLHNDGLAIDFGTRESGNDLGAHTNDESLHRWKASWLFAWLRAHGNDYGFFQNTTIDEPWHWEFRGRPTASTHAWVRPLAAISTQTLPVNDLALLRDHHDVNPDLILRWNDMPGIPDMLDIVVHLHGFSAAHHLNLNGKLPFSGLDFVPPAAPSGMPTQPAWSGRTRPTLCILPRGKVADQPRKDGIWPYRFPAILRPAAFRSLIDESIARFCSAVGATGPIPIGRVILTAHSGGGAPLDAILAFTESLALDPSEIHVFDALYGGTSNIERWLLRRLGEDVRRLAAGVPDPAAYVRHTAGAMRIYFIDGAGTQNGSRHLDSAARQLIPPGTAYASALRDRYRADATSVGHTAIPYWYGGRLLADASQTIPRR